jgi:hypothetical protein
MATRGEIPVMQVARKWLGSAERAQVTTCSERAGLPYKQEVTGSSPVPPTQKGPGNGAFLVHGRLQNVAHEHFWNAFWNTRRLRVDAQRTRPTDNRTR